MRRTAGWFPTPATRRRSSIRYCRAPTRHSGMPAVGRTSLGSAGMADAQALEVRGARRGPRAGARLTAPTGCCGRTTPASPRATSRPTSSRSATRCVRAHRRPAGHPPALPRGHRGRGVLSEEPAQGRARLRAHRHVPLPERAAARPARRRRDRHRRVGGADEHDHLPPVAGAHRRQRQPRRAAHRPRPAARARLPGLRRGGRSRCAR